MKKQIVKGAGSLCLCWMGLMAAVCVPSFIAGVMYTKSGGPAALVKASVGGAEDDIPSLSGAANPVDWPRAESCGRDANDTATCGRERRTGETFSHTHRRALGSGVKYINVTTCNK